VCVYVCMYLCVCMCVYVYVFVCGVHVCLMLVFGCVYLCKYVCVCVCVGISVTLRWYMLIGFNENGCAPISHRDISEFVSMSQPVGPLEKYRYVSIYVYDLCVCMCDS